MHDQTKKTIELQCDDSFPQQEDMMDATGDENVGTCKAGRNFNPAALIAIQSNLNIHETSAIWEQAKAKGESVDFSKIYQKLS